MTDRCCEPQLTNGDPPSPCLLYYKKKVSHNLGEYPNSWKNVVKINIFCVL